MTYQHGFGGDFGPASAPSAATESADRFYATGALTGYAAGTARPWAKRYGCDDCEAPMLYECLACGSLRCGEHRDNPHCDGDSE